MIPCGPDVWMADFAAAKITELLSIAATAIRTAAGTPDEESVHKMRVSIRRLQQGLRLFRQFLKGRAVDRIRADLKTIMEPAGELRNYDIALELLHRARQESPEIRARHLAARQVLREVLSRVAAPDLAARWSAELGIEAHEAEALEA